MVQHFDINPVTGKLDLVGLTSVHDDPNPTLGGDLDVNGFRIISKNNGDISIQPNGFGQIILEQDSWPTTDGSAGQFLTTDGAGQLGWTTVTPGAFNWIIVTSASNPVTLANSTGYIPKGATPVLFVLPAAASVGFNCAIEGYGNLWTITQNAGQTILIGNQTTIAGVGGSVTATVVSDSLELLCVTANLEFKTRDLQGNPSVV